MAYSELIKSFDKIRDYMREFYVYGFKSREEYTGKSARSYDDEKRRIQSYLGDVVSTKKVSNGRSAFISLDSRSISHNPLHRAWKAKSFTNKDITLHFILFDILRDGQCYSLKHLLECIEAEYLSCFDEPISFDESTLRKKLKEYKELGLVCEEKDGRTVLYRITEESFDIREYQDAIRFFTEESPLGIIGSYLEDKYAEEHDDFLFKNHYINGVLDSEILEVLLQAIHEHRCVEITNFSRVNESEKVWKVIPFKIYISTQTGRNYLLCEAEHGSIMSYRVDYIRKATALDKIENYELHLERFEKRAEYMWGVVCEDKEPESLEMDIYVGEGEDYIVRRLRRERRQGTVEKVDASTYRFRVRVYDSYEMVPWIRTFMGRILRIECSNPRTTEQLERDARELAEVYGGDGYDFS